MKVNVYAVSVIGFTALVLLLVVATFIGPRSDAAKPYTDLLDKLAVDIESQNSRLRDEVGAWDCQTALQELNHLHEREGNTWSWIVGLHSSFVVEVANSQLPLPESVYEDWVEFAQLQDEGWQIINQKLAGCIDNQGGSDDNSRD